MSPSVDHVVDPAYLEGLADRPLAEIRAKRQECQDLENALSYVRRLVHGRLDIVRSELELRMSGAPSAGIDAIVDRLPTLLAEGSRSSALPRPPQDLAPGSLAESLVDELEDTFPVSSIGSVPHLTVDELGDLAQQLTDRERTVSDGRARLHEVIDRLHEEIIRRYQRGDASVDSLLE